MNIFGWCLVHFVLLFSYAKIFLNKFRYRTLFCLFRRNRLYSLWKIDFDRCSCWRFEGYFRCCWGCLLWNYWVLFFILGFFLVIMCVIIPGNWYYWRRGYCFLFWIFFYLRMSILLLVFVYNYGLEYQGIEKCSDIEKGSFILIYFRIIFIICVNLGLFLCFDYFFAGFENLNLGSFLFLSC